MRRIWSLAMAISVALSLTGTLNAQVTLNGAVVGNGRIVTGTTDTLTAADCGRTIHYTSGSSVTVTAPNNITTLECVITLVQEGAGTVNTMAATGAIINSAHGYTKTLAQWAAIALILNTNVGGTSAVYTLVGDGA
jgi:hypothetical protein